MSFTVQLSAALERADLVMVNGASLEDFSVFPDKVVAATSGWAFYFTEQPIQISEDGLALVRDRKGSCQELEFFMQRPMVEADLL